MAILALLTNESLPADRPSGVATAVRAGRWF